MNYKVERIIRQIKTLKVNEIQELASRLKELGPADLSSDLGRPVKPRGPLRGRGATAAAEIPKELPNYIEAIARRPLK